MKSCIVFTTGESWVVAQRRVSVIEDLLSYRNADVAVEGVVTNDEYRKASFKATVLVGNVVAVTDVAE